MRHTEIRNHTNTSAVIDGVLDIYHAILEENKTTESWWFNTVLCKQSERMLRATHAPGKMIWTKCFLLSKFRSTNTAENYRWMSGFFFLLHKNLYGLVYFIYVLPKVYEWLNWAHAVDSAPTTVWSNAFSLKKILSCNSTVSESLCGFLFVGTRQSGDVCSFLP